LNTKTVDDLSKSDPTSLKFDEFIEISNAVESKLQEQTIISAYELLKLQHESEILREQVESLKQELEYKEQLIEIYRQELLEANSEIENLNFELHDLFTLENFKLDHAKQLARNILRSRRFTSESLAKLISAMCCVVVTADELDAIASHDEAFDAHGEDAA
jgi:predicted RNase H-like nuclease (RuvC/YqgF family)